MDARFVEAFAPRYQRNNKKSQKNLRCFPGCNETGHTQSGFCGRSLSARISGIQLPLGFSLRVWGEFVESGADDQLRPGTGLSVKEAVAKERCRENPILAWVKGEVSLDPDSGGTSATIIFNRQLLGWHYGWVSTKHTCDSYHSFKVYLFSQPPNSDKLTFLFGFNSPEFQLHSRRRQRAAESSGPDAVAALTGTKRKANEMTPVFAMSSAAEDCEGLEMILREKEVEMDRNRCIDRLTQFIMQFSDPAASRRAQMEEATDWFPELNSGQLDPIDHSTPSTHSNATPNQNQNYFETNNFVEYDPGLEPDLFFGLGSGISTEDLAKVLDANDLRPPSPSTSSGADDSSKPPTQTELPAFHRLRRILARHGKMSEMQMDDLLNKINKISEQVIQHGRENDGFNRLFKRYSSPRGLRELKDQIMREREASFNDFVWTREHDDETFDPICTQNNTENSFFAQVRHNFRVLMHTCLAYCGYNIDDFVPAMELAAKYRLIAQDSFYPPTLKVAAFIHMQLHGNLHFLAKQDYGARKAEFADDEQRLAYARDMLIVRRSIFRRLICNRLIQTQRLRKLQSNTAIRDPPPPRQYDINGTWIRLADDVSGAGEKTRMMHALGMGAGSFMGELYESMYAKVTITLTLNAIVLQGLPVLLANPVMHVPLAGPPHSFRPATPLPMGPLLHELQSIGWLDSRIRPDHSNLIYMVVVGHELPAELTRLMLTEDEVKGEGSPLRTQSLAFLRRFGPDCKPAILVVKKLVIAPGVGEKESVLSEEDIYLVGNAAYLPDIADRGALSMFVKNPPPSLCMRLLSHSTKMIRNYMNTADTDAVLGMLT